MSRFGKNGYFAFFFSLLSLLFGLLLAFLALSTTILPYEREGDGVVSILLINTVKKFVYLFNI